MGVYLTPEGQLNMLWRLLVAYKLLSVLQLFDQWNVAWRQPWLALICPLNMKPSSHWCCHATSSDSRKSEIRNNPTQNLWCCEDAFCYLWTIQPSCFPTCSHPTSLHIDILACTLHLLLIDSWYPVALPADIKSLPYKGPHTAAPVVMHMVYVTLV